MDSMRNVSAYILECALRDAADYFESIGDDEFLAQMESAKHALKVLCRTESE